MDFYHICLLAFVLVNGSMLYRQWQAEKQADLSEEPRKCDTESPKGDADISATASATAFKKMFFPVYALVWAADWLQGPFVYTLYRDEKRLPEETVARLFATGFLAGAISAFFVGSLADKYGRRLACLACCAIMTLSCLAILSEKLVILFIGRALGGLGTTLMYTVFEAWMVTEYNQRSLERTNLTLNSMFGSMITLSSIAAILTGLVGQLLVEATGTNGAPFIASICCLASAALMIWRHWVYYYHEPLMTSLTISFQTENHIDSRIPLKAGNCSGKIRGGKCQTLEKLRSYSPR